MTDYIPTTDDVRDALNEWMWHSRTWRPDLIRADTNGAFDRFLDQVRREAKVEALRSAARTMSWFGAQGNLVNPDTAQAGVAACIGVLESCANQLEQEGKNDD